MNIKKIEKEIEVTEARLTKLKNLRDGFLELFSEEPLEKSVRKSVSRPYGERILPAGEYRGKKTLDALEAALRRIDVPVSARILTSVVFDLPEHSKSKTMKQKVWSVQNMMRNNSMFYESADSKWVLVTKIPAQVAK